MNNICNICGGSQFTWPEFRITKSLTVYQGNEDVPPMCNSCHSLERHRIIKNVYTKYKKESSRPILFSDDPAIKYMPPNTEVSIYNKINSIDLQNIEKDDESYDLIFHHHILEHIENDELAFSELCRILRKNGQMFWSVPSPTIIEKTIIDDPTKNSLQHYRWYGKDFISTVQEWSVKYNISTTPIYGTDTITNFTDLIFLSEKY